MSSAVLKFTRVPVTSVYGWRVLKKTGQRNHHDGADTANGSKYPHSAFGDGIVVASPQLVKHWKYGWFIRIKHADGIETSHHSLDKRALFKVGDRVQLGQIIGYAGTSALSASGNHVHNALWLDGEHVDPLKYLTPGVAVTVSTDAPASVPVAVPVPPAAPSVTVPPSTSPISSGDSVFIAVRNGSFYLTISNAGKQSAIPLGKEDTTENVPIIRFNSDMAWRVYKQTLTNPGIVVA